jgi:hypothetical protein
MNLFALIVIKPLPCFQVGGLADEAEQDQYGVVAVDDQRSTWAAWVRTFSVCAWGAQQMGSCVVSKKVSVEYLTR